MTDFSKLSESQLDMLSDTLRREVVDPDGLAEKVKDRITKERGVWWLRKVVALSGIMTASAALLRGATPMHRSLVKALHSIYAADLIADLHDNQPNADPNDLAKTMIADATELVEVVTGLASNLESNGTLATLLGEAGPTKH